MTINFLCEPSPLNSARLDPITSEEITIDTDKVDQWCTEVSSNITPAEWFDYGTNSLHLTPNGTPLPKTGIGSQGKWLFPGLFVAANGHYLSRADTAALRISGDTTFAAWIQLASAPIGSTRVILSKRSLVGGLEYQLLYNGTSRRLAWQMTFEVGGFGYIFTTQGPTLALNTWYLVIASYDATLSRAGLSVNGGAPVYGGAAPAAFTPGAEFRIGAIAEVGNEGFFDGRIEQVVRWNRLLDIAERAALFQNSILDLAGIVFTPASGDYPPVYEVHDDIPAAPTNLAVTIDGTAATLSWTCNAPNETCVEIERSVDGGAFVQVETVPRGTTEWTDPTADVTAFTYAWRIRSVNNAGASAYSATVSAGPVSANGTGYRFEASGAFYLFNDDSGGWHELSIVGESLNIGDVTSPSEPDGSAPTSGTYYEFSTDVRFRLKDDAGNFREFWAEAGALTFDSPGTASDEASAALSPGALYKFENGEFYLYDITNLEWLAVSIVGAAGFEQLQLG